MYNRKDGYTIDYVKFSWSIKRDADDEWSNIRPHQRILFWKDHKYELVQLPMNRLPSL